MMREPAGLGTSCLSASRAPRGGVFWTQPLLRQADGADLVVRQARAWKFVQVGCRMMQSAPPRIVTGPRCRARSLEGLAHHQQTPERSRANARPADRTTLRRAFRHFKTNEKKRKRSRLQERSEGSRRKQSDHHPSLQRLCGRPSGKSFSLCKSIKKS